MVSMGDLRAMFTDLGLADARTLLQSGNVVFEAPADARSADELERRLEGEAKERLGRPIDFFVRGAKEWARVIARNPFPAEAKRDPGHLVVMALKAVPAAGAIKALQAAIKG